MDYLKEELSILKEEYRNIFLLLLANLTGTFTSFYQVLIQKVPFYILLISVLGVVTAVFILIILKKIRNKMDIIIKKMENMQ